MEIHLAFHALDLNAVDVVENSRLEHVVQRANVRLLALVQRQHLPAAAPVHGHASELQRAQIQALEILHGERPANVDFIQADKS